MFEYEELTSPRSACPNISLNFENPNKNASFLSMSVIGIRPQTPPTADGQFEAAVPGPADDDVRGQPAFHLHSSLGAAPQPRMLPAGLV